jgi:hypothetical protein
MKQCAVRFGPLEYVGPEASEFSDELGNILADKLPERMIHRKQFGIEEGYELVSRFPASDNALEPLPIQIRFALLFTDEGFRWG